jgi:hypothetical protein
MKLEPIIQMHNMLTGTWRRFGVHVFEGQLTLDDMTRLDMASSAWMRRNPGRLVELVIVYPSDTRMTSTERERMALIVKKWESMRTASATVILATGLIGAMHRSILTGIRLLAPPPHPMKIFGDTAEAVTWIAPHVAELCGAEATAPALNAAVEDFCTTFLAMRAANLR